MIALTGFAIFTPATAQAGAQSASLGVSATVEASCTIAAKADASTSTGTLVESRCTSPAPVMPEATRLPTPNRLAVATLPRTEVEPGRIPPSGTRAIDTQAGLLVYTLDY